MGKTIRDPLTYAECARRHAAATPRHLATNGGVKLADNTVLERHVFPGFSGSPHDYYSVRFYMTQLLRFDADGEVRYAAQSGASRTTLARFTTYGPYAAFQSGRVAYVATPYGRVPLADGYSNRRAVPVPVACLTADVVGLYDAASVGYEDLGDYDVATLMALADAMIKLALIN